MIHWLWLIPCVCAGFAAGCYCTVWGLMDWKLRIDDERCNGGRNGY